MKNTEIYNELVQKMREFFLKRNFIQLIIIDSCLFLLIIYLFA